MVEESAHPPSKVRELPLDDSASWVRPKDICTPLVWSEIFPVEQPIELELGAGDGAFIAARAQAHPEINFLAVERLLGRARKIARKAARLKLPNLKVLRLESSYTLQFLIPPGSVSIVHLMFPDPWPKRKHWHHRLVQEEFLTSLAKVLPPQSEFRFTTDHEEYFTVASALIDTRPEFKSTELWDYSVDPLTDFQKGFIAEGRTIYRRVWVRALAPQP